MFLPRMFVIHMVGRVKDKNIEAKYVYDEYKAKSADANWFSLGLGGEILRAWKGNTMSDPLLNIF